MRPKSSRQPVMMQRDDRADAAAARRAAVDDMLAEDAISETIRARKLDPAEVRRLVLAVLDEQAPVSDRDWLVLAKLKPSSAVKRRAFLARLSAALAGSFEELPSAAGLVASAVVAAYVLLHGSVDVQGLAPIVAVAAPLVAALVKVLTAGTQAGADRYASVEVLRERIHTKVLLPIVRDVINSLVESLFSRRVALDDVGGLADLFDDRYEIDTASGRALAHALTDLRAGSLGLFGPRGAGKSTLIRATTAGRLAGWRKPDVVGVMVPAPVRYEAREFVPFLLGRLCLAVTRPVDQRIDAVLQKQRGYQAIIRFATPVAVVALVAMIVWAVATGASKDFVKFVTAYGVSVGAILFGAWTMLRHRLRGLGTRDPLVAEARDHLRALRYLETTTEEWSGEVSAKTAKLGRKIGRSFAAQALTLPEVTARYDDFVTSVVAARGAVVIGIDELDKMATAEDTARFLNEIKALFGRKGVYYLVSLSEDAAASFERRGSGIRDVFDSVFDDVLRVDPLDVEESVAILKRRVIGMQPPFGELCHVISGGLPRELIRCAREAAALAEKPQSAEIGQLMRKMLCRRAAAREHALAGVAARHVGPDGAQPVLAWLRSLEPPRSADGILERTRVGAPLLDTRAGDERAPDLELALLNFAAWCYHAASVLEWTDRLTSSRRLATAGRGAAGESTPLQLLSRAPLDLTIAPALAWETVSAFREAVGLTPEAYPIDVTARLSAVPRL